MATHKSAEKRHRQNLKRRTQNRLAKSTYRSKIKNALEFATAGKTEEAQVATRAAIKLLDKAAVHGVHHKKKVSRHISRLQKNVNKLLAAAS